MTEAILALPAARLARAARPAPAKADMLARGGRPMNAGKPGFVESTWSLVLRAAGEPTTASRRAFGELFETYRAPLAVFARSFERDPVRREDLVQGFFAYLLGSGALGKASAARGRFRNFLRTSFRNYAIDVHRIEARHAAPPAEVDFDRFESGDPAQDRLFDQGFAQAAIDRVLAQLGDEYAQRGQGAVFAALRERLEHGDDDVTVRAVAATLGMSEVGATAALRRLRVRFRARLREEVAGTCERPEDVDVELAELRAAWRDQP